MRGLNAALPVSVQAMLYACVPDRRIPPTPPRPSGVAIAAMVGRLDKPRFFDDSGAAYANSWESTSTLNN